MIGCAFDEERSPHHTGPSSCAGEIKFFRGEVEGVAVDWWSCEAHAED